MGALLLLFAFAQDTAHSESGIPEWVPSTVNLAIFLAFLYFVLRKPLASFFEARAAAIRAGIDKARIEKEAAQAKLREVEQRLSQLEADKTRVLDEAAAEADAEAERVSKMAEYEAAKIADTATREIDGALKNARAELRKFAAEKAVELAEGVIRRELNDADAKKLVDEYASQLEGVKR